jgi:hypothetical protein
MTTPTTSGDHPLVEPIRLKDLRHGARLTLEIGGWLVLTDRRYRVVLDGGEVLTFGPEYPVASTSEVQD